MNLENPRYRLARLYRVSNYIGLSQNVLDRLKHLVIKGQLPLAIKSDSDCQISDEKHLALKIRQLVEADADWNQIKSLAWQLYHNYPTAAHGSKMVELVTMHGSADDLYAVLEQLSNVAHNIYKHVHPKLRTILVSQLWANHKQEILDPYILLNSSEKFSRLPIEHLYIYHRLLTEKQTTKALTYFQKYEDELSLGISEFGPQIRWPKSRFLLTASELAISHGFEELAARLLKNIKQDDPEYSDAIRLIVKVAQHYKSEKDHKYFKSLSAAKSWKEQIQVLKNAFVECQRHQQPKNFDLPVLNEILVDPLKYVERSSEAWSALSRLIVDHIEMEKDLPNLLTVFQKNALTFHAPTFDAALWQAAFSDLVESNGRNLFWKSVAALHQYINFNGNNEKILWQAKFGIENADQTWAWPLPFDWSELHGTALNWVAKTPYLFEKQRQPMLRQLRVATDLQFISTIDIEEYLHESEHPPFEVLDFLQKIANTKRAYDLELQIIAKRSALSHYRNQDLDQLWKLACCHKHHDLAWRIATVLKTREALSKLLYQPWSISGEKRTQYAFSAIKWEDLKNCLTGFSSEQKKLAHSCLLVGPLIPELLAILDSNAKIEKPYTPAANSVESEIENILDQLRWLPKPKKVYHYSYDGVFSQTIQLPVFVQVLPSNSWSYVLARVSDRLGINAWHWKMSRLHEQIQDLIPRLASKQDLSRFSIRVGRWLRMLSPEQRSAWHDLATLSSKISDDGCQETLAILLCRIAICIYQNHLEALTSLRTMRAPINIIWAVESWILSDSYSTLRRKLSATTAITVPVNLQELPTILDTPDN